MRVDRRERAAALLIVTLPVFYFGFRPALAFVAPDAAVQAQDRRDRLDPWGTPFVDPPRPVSPGRLFGGWTGPTYSAGPNGVDDTAAVVPADQRTFPVDELFPSNASLPIERRVPLPRPPFDDRRDGKPAPAWDGHFRALLAGDDILVSSHLTLATQLLSRDVEVWLLVAVLGVCWLLVVGRRVRRAGRVGRDLVRFALFASVPVACAVWLGVQVARVPAVGRDVGLHPMVPLVVALGGSAALFALVAALAVHALAPRADVTPE